MTKESFDLDSIISAAGELKYIGQLKRILAAQFKQPEDEWVRFLTNRVYDGAFTQRVRDQFIPLVEKATQQFLNEQVNDRLKNALGGPDAYVTITNGAATDTGQTAADSEPADKSDDKAKVTTTEEELEGFRVVRAITCAEVTASRITPRDNQSYFSVLLDDNNRKPIARLWFNRPKKYLGIFDENKEETRVPIDHVEDIYRHAEHLRRTVVQYLNITPAAPIEIISSSAEEFDSRVAVQPNTPTRLT
ncbi:hypothetical protein [Amycolatopsis jiangsuensis]|uniref:Uncharacterized protein n=1 Tax=Amycolatopsis jiangsuensis TaxID=1181879 RepID=A0A840ILV0_9PSEU|nr:hypothetical protein [Amycolatopsis jiangsuensis]MBB4682549.1 hypothetical protein [Amycolatopsis jiangsuensis]